MPRRCSALAEPNIYTRLMNPDHRRRRATHGGVRRAASLYSCPSGQAAETFATSISRAGDHVVRPGRPAAPTTCCTTRRRSSASRPLVDNPDDVDRGAAVPEHQGVPAETIRTPDRHPRHPLPASQVDDDNKAADRRRQHHRHALPGIQPSPTAPTSRSVRRPSTWRLTGSHRRGIVDGGNFD